MAVEEEPIPGPPDWVVTFGDMMTLLMCFFILLLAMGGSRASDEQVKMIMDSLRRQFGDDFTDTAGLVPPDFDGYKWSGAANGRKDGGDAHEARSNSPLKRVRDSEPVGVGGRILFENDASPLSEQGRRDVEIAAEELRGRLQRIEIRAIVDLGSMNGADPENDPFELALARCRSVMQTLVELGIEPERMRLDIATVNSGMLGARPIKDRSTVEIVMLDELIEPPHSAHASTADHEHY